MYLIANSLLTTIIVYVIFLAAIVGAGAFTILGGIEVFYHLKYKYKKDPDVNTYLIKHQMIHFLSIAAACWIVAAIFDRIVTP